MGSEGPRGHGHADAALQKSRNEVWPQRPTHCHHGSTHLPRSTSNVIMVPTGVLRHHTTLVGDKELRPAGKSCHLSLALPCARQTHRHLCICSPHLCHTQTQVPVLEPVSSTLLKMLSNMESRSTSIILVELINCSGLHIPIVETGGTPKTSLSFQSNCCLLLTVLPPSPLYLPMSRMCFWGFRFP